MARPLLRTRSGGGGGGGGGLVEERFIQVSPHGKFAPTEFAPHERNLNFLCRVRQWINEREVNKFCYIVHTILSFFHDMGKINLKHLIAR